MTEPEKGRNSPGPPPPQSDVHETPHWPTDEDLIRTFMEATGKTREEAIAFHGEVLKEPGRE
jgi:hypothetical protein